MRFRTFLAVLSPLLFLLAALPAEAQRSEQKQRYTPTSPNGRFPAPSGEI